MVCCVHQVRNTGVLAKIESNEKDVAYLRTLSRAWRVDNYETLMDNIQLINVTPQILPQLIPRDVSKCTTEYLAIQRAMENISKRANISVAEREKDVSRADHVRDHYTDLATLSLVVLTIFYW